MDKYDGLTDYQINKAVDDALGIPSGTDYSDGMICDTQTDYTGANSVCMKLMLDYEISLIKLDGTNVWIACAESRFENICMRPDGSDNGISAFDCKHSVHHTKPLRAVCECFLMMQQT